MATLAGNRSRRRWAVGVASATGLALSSHLVVAPAVSAHGSKGTVRVGRMDPADRERFLAFLEEQGYAQGTDVGATVAEIARWRRHGRHRAGTPVAVPVDLVPTPSPPTPVVPVPIAPAPLQPAAVATPVGGTAASLNELNTLRAGLGRRTVSESADLSSYALAWAKEMARSGFRHSDSNARRALLTGGRTGAGENIAWFSDATLTPEQAAARFHQMWVNSPGHYSNMTSSDWTEVGIGLFQDTTGWYGVHVFSNR